MPYRIEISEKALGQLRGLPRELRRNIGHRIENLRDGFQGDVMKLKAQSNRYRLRVGSYRVLFTLSGDAIQVYAIKDRKEAYD